MKGKLIQKILFASTLASAPFCATHGGELPPSGGKPLSTIIRSVEEQRLGSISEVEFDDGLWEVKVCNSGACQKLYIAPESGEEKRRRNTGSDEIPPADAKPLSAIIKSIEDSGKGALTEIEFDDGLWKAELHNIDKKIKLKIDPRTGKTMGPA